MGVKATIKGIRRNPAGEGLVLLLITGVVALLRLAGGAGRRAGGFERGFTALVEELRQAVQRKVGEQANRSWP